MKGTRNGSPRKGTPGLSNRLYRAAAQAAGRLLGSSELVESIYVHRSLAGGETTFAKSDIDLAIITRRPVIDPRDIEALLSLLRRVRNLHFGLRVFGECEVHDPGGAQLWTRTEPYWGSMNRRSAFVVYGKPVQLPAVAIGADAAALRTVSFLGKHLPRAVQKRNARQLRKCVLDAWNAYVTATGLIREPYLTRGECARNARLLGEWRLPEGQPWKLEEGISLYAKITRRLHGQMLPELQQIQTPLIFRALLPPTFQPRTFVIVPSSNTSLPPEAFGKSSIVFTPEALHLFLHYANSFAWWAMPPEALRLGLRRPSVESFVRSCHFHGIPFRCRAPGFIDSDSQAAVGRVISIGHAVEWLVGGEAPPPLPPDQVDALRRMRISVEDYYRSAYAALYRDLMKIWERLDGMTSSSSSVKAAPAAVSDRKALVARVPA